MNTSILIALISSGIVTSVATWFLSRRKHSAEAQSTEIDNLQKAVAMWRDIVDYQTKEIGALRQEIDGLKKEIRNIEKLYTEKHAEKCRNCKYKKRYENESAGN